MDKIALFFKGLIIGIGKIIPGVSGALFAIVFKVYEPLMECISNPKLLLKRFNFIFPLGIGIIFSIMFGSNIIVFLLENNHVESMFFFLGLMSYGIVPLLKEIKEESLTGKEIAISILCSVLFFSLFFLGIQSRNVTMENGVQRFISLSLCGFLEAASALIPGISGSAILMMLGYYVPIMNSLANISISSLEILIPFIIGLMIGMIYIAKLLNYIIKKWNKIFKIFVLIFLIFSILYLLLELTSQLIIVNIITYIILFLIGFGITFAIEKKF